ncbi:protein of unknown function [Taphrina deformans PYCC 5710]|uniref:3-hydroxyisobutyryl-CoA hydrolase n=1 Tax=Taphrina deformans (strain PYCC 5710 / ATCC 11124 / CBS 356.35 / IMI 108563 / JCM 9778 / NBRC 8474) TaxID=1097556 RepID=R4XNL3_TAPDE|nr:protein of unknown function [Taphrina deformans PYCC 5710]|eukprot:CCG84835.1 protein of unknown function [Taphrina deformans PYCC 5710]
MPLRAKIDPASPLSTDASLVPDSPFVPDDVLFSSTGSVRKVILNRPKKLNSLDLSMIQKIQPRLEQYAKSSDSKIILIAGNGRAFCAGGDVATLAESNKAGKHHIGKEYFAAEYRLDHAIATYTKPVVAMVDGICMGGGVGLTINAPIRVVSEKTVFAMPESTIGFFPDVGASRFLAKLGNVGKYLACTASRLTGAQVVLAGLGTHFVPSERLSALEARLAELETSDLGRISRTIDEFTEKINETFELGRHERELTSFEASSIPLVLKSLDKFATDGSKFAAQTAATMRQKSPVSLAVALRAQREGVNWGIDEVFEKEYNIACEFMHNEDFVEGVESTLKHKRLGEWKVKNFDVNVDKYFNGRARLF